MLELEQLLIFFAINFTLMPVDCCAEAAGLCTAGAGGDGDGVGVGGGQAGGPHS